MRVYGKPFFLNRKEYEDKVYACWLGKNIGGTIGAPYEGTREMLDIPGFATPEGVALPNDDLDLQLVWLHAMEELGPYAVTPQSLGDMWLSFITPWWNEYGICKANMQRGLIPPLSGQYKNSWKNSNGAWIRTEIWATLLPASPDAAVKYAYYDASVDHGHAEGTYAAAFIAAVESAAFVVSDIRELIEIGLKRIPDESRVAKTIALLLKLYDSGKPWQDARNAIQQANSDIGDGWFEAPSNVGYAMLGILYGEGDFKKSMITAVNCGDDTDCTAATVGSILGIMGGTKAIPDDWKKHIGDSIVTISLAAGTLHHLPKTCTELTEHVIKLAPHTLFANRSTVEITDQATDDIESIADALNSTRLKAFFKERKPHSYTVSFNHSLAEVSFDKSPDISPLESIDVSIRIMHNSIDFLNLFGTPKYGRGYSPNTDSFGNLAVYYSFRWLLPEGWAVSGPMSAKADPSNTHSDGSVTVKFTITAGEKVEAVNRPVLEVVTQGMLTVGYIPITLIG